MVDYFDRTGQYIRAAIGPADLTAWANANAALVVGELIAFDRLQEAHIDWCEPETIEVASTSPPLRLEAGYKRGKAILKTWFMTGILDYVVMGACTTTEATPNIHAITFTTGNDPPRFAIHAEKEETNNPQRDDGMGWITLSDDIFCDATKTGWNATRATTAEFAYSGVGGDLAAPTALTFATHRPYSWSDYKHASSTSDFQINSTAIGFDITGFHIHKGWAGGLFSAYSGNYPTVGKFIKPYNYFVDVTGYRTDTGTDIADIVKLTPDALIAIGDLDMIIDFYQSATKYHKHTFDKMYIPSQSWKESYAFDGGGWIPGHTFTLAPLDSTSSCVIEEKNALNNDYYENPA